VTEGSSINKLPPRKRKKRQTQLRDAQRRRRARLKEGQMTFLQLILDSETFDALRKYSETSGKPIRICATELLNKQLGVTPTPPETDGVLSSTTAEPALTPQCDATLDTPSPISKGAENSRAPSIAPVPPEIEVLFNQEDALFNKPASDQQQLSLF
jgi:hypothetical protein